MGKDIFVISDLHMGDQGARDNFHVGDREEQFGLFLDYVKEQGAPLYVLGDLFELWQANVSSVVMKRMPILDRLAELEAKYVVGNHDVDLKSFINTGLLSHPIFSRMTGPFTETIGGRSFKFMHGHETDPFNKSEEPSTGRMLAIFAGLVEDWNGSPVRGNKSVEAQLEKTGEKILDVCSGLFTMLKHMLDLDEPPDLRKGLTPAQHRSRLDDHLHGIEANRNAEGYDVAVVGHTHQPGQVGDWYFNSGSWAATTNDFLVIHPDGNVECFQWNAGQAQGMSMPILYEGRYETSHVEEQQVSKPDTFPRA